MRELDIPAVFAATALPAGALDRLARSARRRDLLLSLQTENGPVPIGLGARPGEGEGLDGAAVPALLLDLARIGLAAVHGAYTAPQETIGRITGAEVARLRQVGLAMPTDPGVHTQGT